MSLDRDCCLETYTDGYRAGAKDERERKTTELTPEVIREIIAYLKPTYAVTLGGTGGAYELLEELAVEIEKRWSDE
jgi:hypothetical protein